MSRPDLPRATESIHPVSLSPAEPSTRRRWNLMDALFRLGAALNPIRDPHARDRAREDDRKKRLNVKPSLFSFEERNGPSDAIVGNLITMNLVHLGFEGILPTRADEERWLKALGSAPAPIDLSSQCLDEGFALPSPTATPEDGSARRNEGSGDPLPPSPSRNAPEIEALPTSGSALSNPSDDSFRGLSVGGVASASDSGAALLTARDVSAVGSADRLASPASDPTGGSTIPPSADPVPAPSANDSTSEASLSPRRIVDASSEAGTPNPVAPATPSDTPSAPIAPRSPVVPEPRRDLPPAVPATPLPIPSTPTPSTKIEWTDRPIRFVDDRDLDRTTHDFRAQGLDYGLWIGATGATLALRSAGRAAGGVANASADSVVADVVRLTLSGNPNASTAEGVGASGAVSHYFLGDDPSKWRTNVASYSGVLYREVYDGVDLHYYGTDGRNLEFDFIVAPGADPSSIGFDLDGVESARIEPNGDLTLTTPNGSLTQKAPVLYQNIDGVRRSVEGRFVLDGTRLSFAVGAYDPTRTLVIDPVLDYGSYLGGTDGSQRATDVAVGEDGSVVVVGITTADDFPQIDPLPGSAYVSANNVFVARFDPTGELVFSSYLGGEGEIYPIGLITWGNAVALGPDGSIYVTGYTTDEEFPTTVGAFQTTLDGADAFVSKLAPDGSALTYSTFLGGSNKETGSAIAVDSLGRAWVAGATYSTDFDTQNAYQASKRGFSDSFVTRLSADGSALGLSTYYGGELATGTEPSGEEDEAATSIALRGDSGAVVVGYTAVTDLPGASGGYRPLHGSDGWFNYSNTYDAFLAEFGETGKLLSSTYLGGTGEDRAFDVALDGQGQIHVVGTTQSSDFPTAGGGQSLGGGKDAFVASFRTLREAPVYSTFLGGSGDEEGYSIDVDADRRAVVGGRTTSTNFPTVNPNQSSREGSQDGFVTRYGTDSASRNYSSYWGGDGDDSVNGVAASSAGRIVLAGGTSSSDLPTQGSYSDTLSGSEDAFVGVLLTATSAVVGSGGGSLLPRPAVTSITTDTGSSGSDRLTSDNTLSFSGTSPTDTSVALYENKLDGRKLLLGTTTASGGTWTIDYTGTALSEGVHSFVAATTTSGEVSSDSDPFFVTIDATAPVVVVESPENPYSVKPVVRVTTTDTNSFATLSSVTLDVDLNNDADFLDAGEAAFATAALVYGVAEIRLTTALSVGTVRFRARVTDKAGNEGTSSTLSHTVTSRSSWSITSLTPSTRLDGGGLSEFLGSASERLPLDLDRSPGTSGSDYAALIYQSHTVDSKPFVQATLNTPNSVAALPPQVIAYLTWDGTTTSQTYTLGSDYALGDALTVSLQPAANQSTGRHAWTLDLVADYATDPDVTTTYSGQTFVVNDNASPFGAGWSYGSTDRLVAVSASGGYPAGVLRLKGSGGWAFYEQGAGVTYTNAAGQTGTLISAGGGWESTSTEGVKRTFDSSGRQTKTLFANGVESFTYDYSGSQLTKVSTPDGAVATFTYASGLLSTVDAVGSRRVTVTHSGSDLSSLVNPVGNATTFAYDASHRMTGETRGTRTRAWAYDSTTKAMSSAQEGSLTAATLTPALAVGRTTAAYRPAAATTTDPTGGVWKDGFTAAGEVVRSVDATGARTILTRDGDGFVAAAVDALGRTTTLTNDAAGYPTRIDYADGSYETFAYHSAQQALTSHRDGNGNRSTFTYDTGGQLLTALDALNRTTTMTWSNGLLQTVTDALNRTTTFTYDASRRLETTVEPGGATTTLSYDATGALAALVDPLGRTTTTVFDAWGRLTGTVDALGHRGTLVYDAADQLTGSIDALGRRTSSVFDTAGRVTALVEAVGTALERRTTFSYDAASRLVGTQDALNRRSTLVYDLAGRVVQTVDGVGSVTSLAYDAAGQLVASMDALGRVSRLSYDALGRLDSATDALGQTSTLVYDAGSNLIASVDALGRRTTSSYDAVDRLVEVLDALGNRSTLVYDSADQLVATVDARGNRTTFAYDARGRTTESLDALGQRGTLVYDAASNLLATVDARGNRTTFVYDAADRLTEQLDALGRRTTFAYDAVGQLTATRDALNRRTTFAYDDLGRLQATLDALGNRTTLVYDAGDQVLATVDALGRRTTFAYDANGRMTGTLDALGGRSTLVYDAVGRVVAASDPLGRGHLFRYDALGRTVETTDALRQVTTLAYDAVGNLLASVDPLGRRTTVSYDALNRVESTLDALGNRATLVYDAVGNVAESVTPRGHRSTFVYDALNRLIESVDALGNRSTLVYDAAGNLQATVDPLGNRTTFAYDALNRTEVVRNALNQRTTLVYDEVGQLVAAVDALGRRATTVYDALGRPIESIDALGNRSTLVYDAVGNRTVAIDALNRRTTSTYDALNRRTVVEDALGHRTTSVFDAASQLVGQTDARGFTGVAYYDPLGRRVPYIDPLGRRGDSHYDAAGNLVREVDEVGNITTMVYDALNRLEATVDPYGHRTTQVYDADSNVIATVDALGRRTTFAYDAVGRLESVRDALSNRTTASYDAASNLTAVQDARGHRTTVSYDALNRPEVVRDALNGLATTVYDAVGNVVASVDQLGRRTTVSYDALNRVEAVQDALSNRTTLSYDAVGNRTAVTDPLGNRTTFVYDALNRTEAVQNALGDRTTVVFDAVGNAIATVDALGRRTTSVYDPVGRRVELLDALGGIVTTTYLTHAKVVTVDDARGHRSTITFDKLNRPQTATDPLGHTVTQVYDAVGNVARTVDALGHSTTFAYDALNRLVGTTKPSGGTWTTGYDAVGNIVSSTDPLNHTSTLVYDALNRSVESLDALSGQTTTVYDAVGNATAMVDPVGNRTTFVYDALNRVSEEIDPLNESTTYAYDALSRLTGTTDRLGQKKEFGYDAASRLTSEVWKTSGSVTVNLQTFTYDAVGNQLTARDNSGTYTLTYDALNRVRTVLEPVATSLTFTYDANGNRTQVDDSFGHAAISTYDAADRLTSRSTEAGAVTVSAAWTYTARNEVSTITYSADSTTVGTTAHTFDTSGRLTNLKHIDGSSSTYSNTTYAYDTADRLTLETQNGSTRTYAYDATDQLTADSTSTFTYDANGNRTSSGYTTGAANRITNDGVWTFTYDDEGRRTKRSKGATLETWTYEYDHDGHLTRVEKFSSDGGTRLLRVDYTLDVWGNRIGRKEYDGSLTLVSEERYAVDGWKPGGVDVWADLDGSNALVVRRVFGDGGEPLVKISAAGDASWYARDRLGSIANVLDAAGTVAATVTYDGFGNVASNSNPSATDRYGYVSRERDVTTGLLHFGGRELALDVGRFLTEDSGDTNPTRYLRNGWPNGASSGAVGLSGQYVGARMFGDGGTKPESPGLSEGGLGSRSGGVAGGGSVRARQPFRWPWLCTPSGSGPEGSRLDRPWNCTPQGNWEKPKTKERIRPAETAGGTNAGPSSVESPPVGPGPKRRTERVEAGYDGPSTGGGSDSPGGGDSVGPGPKGGDYPIHEGRPPSMGMMRSPDGSGSDDAMASHSPLDVNWHEILGLPTAVTDDAWVSRGDGAARGGVESILPDVLNSGTQAHYVLHESDGNEGDWNVNAGAGSGNAAIQLIIAAKQRKAEAEAKNLEAIQRWAEIGRGTWPPAPDAMSQWWMQHLQTKLNPPQWQRTDPMDADYLRRMYRPVTPFQPIGVQNISRPKPKSNSEESSVIENIVWLASMATPLGRGLKLLINLTRSIWANDAAEMTGVKLPHPNINPNDALEAVRILQMLRRGRELWGLESDLGGSLQSTGLELRSRFARGGSTDPLSGLHDARNFTPGPIQRSRDTCGLHTAGQVLDELLPSRNSSSIVIQPYGELEILAPLLTQSRRQRGQLGLSTWELSGFLDRNAGEAIFTRVAEGVSTSELQKQLARGTAIAHVDGGHFVRVTGVVRDANGSLWVQIYDPARGYYQQLLDSFMTRTGEKNQMVFIIDTR